MSSRKITQWEAVKRLYLGNDVWDSEGKRFVMRGELLHYEKTNGQWAPCDFDFMDEPLYDGSTAVAPATFEDALVHLRLGRKVKMSSWADTAIGAHEDAFSYIYYWDIGERKWSGQWDPLLDQLKCDEWLVERDRDWVSASERW